MNFKNILLGVSLIAIVWLWQNDTFEIDIGPKASARISKAKSNATGAVQSLTSAKNQNFALIGQGPSSLKKSGGTDLLISATNSERLHNYETLLAQLNSCLKLTVGAVSNNESTYQNLVEQMKADLGDPVLKSDDWSNTLVKLPDGQQRKIRLETDFGDDKILRRLRYYRMEADGGLIPIEMPADQAANPSDALISSLESGNEIAWHESASRTYFQNGEELNATEMNTFLSEVQITKLEKTLKCTGLDQAQVHCECH